MKRIFFGLVICLFAVQLDGMWSAEYDSKKPKRKCPPLVYATDTQSVYPTIVQPERISPQVPVVHSMIVHKVFDPNVWLFDMADAVQYSCSEWIETRMGKCTTSPQLHKYGKVHLVLDDSGSLEQMVVTDASESPKKNEVIQHGKDRFQVKILPRSQGQGFEVIKIENNR